MSILLATMWLTTTATAGNERANLFGAEAALSAGALVATTRAPESTWYNPAGLGGMERTQLNVNLSAFVLRIRPSDRFLVSSVGGNEIDTPANATQLVSVPSSLSLVRRITPRTALGFGVYVTQANRMNLTASGKDVIGDPADGDTYIRSLQVLSETQQFQIGLSLGTEVTDRVRIGGSILGVYDRSVNASSFFGDLTDSSTGSARRVALNAAASTTTNTIGLRAVIALQWEFAPHWHLGLVVRSPVLGFYRWGKKSESILGSNDPAPPDSDGEQSYYADTRLDEAVALQTDPMRFSLSFGVQYPRFTIGIESEVTLGVVDDSRGDARDVNENLALGARFEAAEKVWFGVGLCSDLNSLRNPALTQSTQDWLGVTAGPEFRNPVRASGRDDGVVFTTAVGVRYAVGSGPYQALFFDGTSAIDGIRADLQLVSKPEPMVFHELAIMIGSAVAF